VNDRDAAMRKLAENAFAADDSALFLVTHPYDRQALSYFHNANRMTAAATDAFVEKYGPLTQAQQTNPNYFDWNDGPWPWEVNG
jgi:spore coat protein JB